jgi:hypothetical protein
MKRKSYECIHFEYATMLRAAGESGNTGKP